MFEPWWWWWWRCWTFAGVLACCRLCAAGGLDSVLLIVNFNSDAHYANTQHVLQLYSAAFESVVFYGPTRSVTWAVAAAHTNHGHEQHAALRLALQTHWREHHSGFLFTNDDVLLNTALLATLPRDRLWLADHDTEQLDVERNQTRRLLVELYNGKRRRANENWFKPWGLAACRGALRSLRAKDWWREKAARVLRQHATHHADTHNGTVFHLAPSDLLYVPARLRKWFVRVCTHFVWSRVHFEIALPTVARALAPPEQLVRLPHAYLWSAEQRARWAHVWRDTLAFLHPVKLSNATTRAAVRAIVQRTTHGAS